MMTLKRLCAQRKTQDPESPPSLLERMEGISCRTTRSNMLGLDFVSCRNERWYEVVHGLQLQEFLSENSQSKSCKAGLPCTAHLLSGIGWVLDPELES